MAFLHEFDYIFAIALIFSFLDAWNIGANDVANSFATSVSSRSLTMKQAMCIATVMEFAGGVGVGHVSLVFSPNRDVSRTASDIFLEPVLRILFVRKFSVPVRLKQSQLFLC
jgi:hypothetical protein